MVPDTSVLIVEPREVLRRGLASMVQALPGVGRCHCVSTVEEVGTAMAGIDGDDTFTMAVARVGTWAEADAVGAAVSAQRSLALIESSSPLDLEAAARIPADGYLLLAEATAERLGTVVDGVLGGHTVVPEALVVHLLERARRPCSVLVSESVRLSPREAEVLELVVAGLTNKEIARHLEISIHGAKRYVSSVLAKFDAPTRSSLISRMLQLGPKRPPGLA